MGQKLMLRGWVVALGLIALFFLPSGGNPTPFALMDKVGKRISTPVTEAEQAELDFLVCLEKTGEVIPDLARVQKVIPDDSYLIQRVGDIYYPRVRFDDENPEYRLYVNSDPGSAELIASANCGQMFVGVEKVD